MSITVQPHWCGEHFLRLSKLNSSSGSAPLVWGTLSAIQTTRISQRFSPTGVGNIFPVQLNTASKSVQPHWCGEHIDYRLLLPALHGSAPLVWGTWQDLPPEQKAVRFSPTGVGNMTTAWTIAKSAAVQPHWCGEHALVQCLIRRKSGSAPLVWGTSPYLPPRPLLLRFSPTGVGNIDTSTST